MQEANLIGVQFEFDVGSSNDGRSQAGGECGLSLATAPSLEQFLNIVTVTVLYLHPEKGPYHLYKNEEKHLYIYICICVMGWCCSQA